MGVGAKLFESKPRFKKVHASTNGLVSHLERVQRRPASPLSHDGLK